MLEKALAVICSLGTVIFGLWALVMTLRNGGLKADKVALKASNQTLRKTVDLQLIEYIDYKKRAQARIIALVDEIESMEDAHHEEIEKIEDPKKRRNRRRAFVADVLDDAWVLSEKTNSAASADEDFVSEDVTTDVGKPT